MTYRAAALRLMFLKGAATCKLETLLRRLRSQYSACICEPSLEKGHAVSGAGEALPILTGGVRGQEMTGNHQVSKARIRGSAASVALVAAGSIGANDLALAADFPISAQTKTFDCSAISPGDTLTIAAGTRGPLKIINCNGTKDSPIVIRNDPEGYGPTLILRNGGTGGFLLNCMNCVGVTIDGSSKWRGAPSGKTYGIRVTMSGEGEPSAFIRFGGLFRFVTIHRVEVDGAWQGSAKYGSGIRMNDRKVKRSANPGLWRERILIEDNYIHNVAQEGLYVGNNYGDV
jgi:hypothetical protein